MRGSETAEPAANQPTSVLSVWDETKRQRYEVKTEDFDAFESNSLAKLLKHLPHEEVSRDGVERFHLVAQQQCVLA